MLDFLAPIKGFGVTFHEMFRKVETVQYPEDKRPTAPRFHGHHQLNRWPDGLEKCIGCELCAWACPADAIYVEGRDNRPGERYSPGERYGAVYQINYLRCILCGMCIEACPTRALTMTNEYEIADDSRENLIWTKEQLLVPLPPGAEAPPHPMRLGDHEKDYYRLGAAGVAATPRAPGMAGPGGPAGQAPARKAMDVELHEVGLVAAPTTEDERIGLALLQLLADAADSQLQSRWVHRRVAQLEFLDTRAVRWRISVDFTVSETAPRIDSGPMRLVPITRWRKSELVKLDFRDEQGAAIPLMTAEVTSRFMAAALYRWASVILRREKLEEPEQMSGELRKIVSETPGPDPERQSADAKVTALLDKVSNGDSRISDALFASKGFRSKLYELSENFVVLAPVENLPGTRRVLKLAFESAVTFQHQHGWLRKVLQLFGWRDWRLQVMLGGRGGSGHLEVAAPTGLDIFKIIARPTFVTDPRKAVNAPEVITTFGKTPHVAIRIPAGARRYRATIYLRVNLSGWLTASWLVSLVIAASMMVGRSQVGAVFSKAAPIGEAGTAATLLLALLGVFASYLIRPGEHPLAARLLRAARGLIMIDVAVVLVAVGDLLLHSGPHQPKGIWDCLAWVSGGIALLLTLSLLLPPWPWSKVTTKEAPHWGADVTSAGAEEVPPEGVPLQAPDGLSYGDTHSWGQHDQRILVQELESVRRAAGFLPDRDPGQVGARSTCPAASPPGTRARPCRPSCSATPKCASATPPPSNSRPGPRPVVG